MAAYKEALAPVGILETELVAEISKMKWRQKRASSAEDSIFSQAHLDYVDDMQSGHPAVDSCLVEGKVWKEQAQALILISLYETRMRRALEKDMAALQALQRNARQVIPAPKTKPSGFCSWLYRRGKPTNPVKISSPPAPTGSSFFQLPI